MRWDGVGAALTSTIERKSEPTIDILTFCIGLEFDVELAPLDRIIWVTGARRGRAAAGLAIRTRGRALGLAFICLFFDAVVIVVVCV